MRVAILSPSRVASVRCRY